MCFILGSSKELSLAELSAACSGMGLSYTVGGVGDDCVELDFHQPHPPVDAYTFMNVLGGCIKIGSFLAEYPTHLPFEHTLAELIAPYAEARLTYGISVSSVSDVPKNKRMHPRTLKQLGFEIKRELKSMGIASRCVISQESALTLSSVVVEKNHLLKPGGIELLIIRHPSLVRVYATKAVQPFEEFSRRDFGRPSRSMSIGMLPPKVARMMVVLSQAPFQKNSALLDPFCGTGTILQESLLLGVSKIVGSDISQKSCDAAKSNIAWLTRNTLSLALHSVDIQHYDARDLHTRFTPATFDAIVTETYLGPILKKGIGIPPNTLRALERLYGDSFESFRKILKPRGRIVIALPCWPSHNTILFLPTLMNSLERVGFNAITHSLLAPFHTPSSRRNSIVWHREGQQVGREICVFELKS